MGFGQKIFLMSFTLIIIAINLIGIFMINHIYESNMQKEIDKNMLQINDIMTEVEYGIDNLSRIANIYLKKNVHIELYNNGKRVYTNLKGEYPQIEEKLLTKEDKETVERIYGNMSATESDIYLNYEQNGQGKSMIRTYMEGDQLFMKLKKYDKVVITLSDISEINKMREEQVEYFIKLSLASSFMIALLLSVSVGFLTRRIKQLNNVVEEVEKGNYEAKVRKVGKDEIGNVGKSFNKMTKAVQKNILEIQEVAENRKRFIGNLTHEIRTPLTSIVGYSSLIKSGKVIDTQTILEYNNRIYEEGKYIEQISQKLMDILLLENGNIEVEEMNLSEEVNSIIEELKEKFPMVVYEKEIAENIWVSMDKTLFKSLMINLVKNAIKAYEKDPIVRIELTKDKVINIIDYGKGIPKEELEKIKEPFYTLSKDRNRRFSGMGLGLPLCIKIIERQKGKLEIQSKEGQGTKVTIKLGVENEGKSDF